MLHLLTRWFTRAERSRANAILLLGNPVTVLWMSAITGYLIQRYGWQMTFIIEGLPSVPWAVVWILFVRDRPCEARWITRDAAKLLEVRLTQEQAGIAPVGAVRNALLRGDVLLLSVQYFCWSLGVYGFVLWLPTIVHRGATMSMAQTGLLSALPYLAAILLMLFVSHISDKTQKRRSLVWPFLLTSGIALAASFFFSQKNFTLTFLALVIGGGCMYAPYGPFFAIIPERVARNVTAEVFALINSCGALGGFFGSYLVGLLQAITGNARAGYLLMSVSLISSAILLMFLPDSPDGTTQAVVEM
jgi:sugar phosphate permease